MIQTRCRFCFPNKTIEIRFVLTKLFVENFDGDFSVKFFIFGKINFAHSARADLFDDFVTPETFSRCEFLCFGFNDARNFGNGGRFHKTFGTVKRRQKRFDFGEQNFIIAAGFVNKSSAFIGLAAQSIVKNLSHLLPIFVCHFFGFQVSGFRFQVQITEQPET